VNGKADGRAADLPEAVPGFIIPGPAFYERKQSAQVVNKGFRAAAMFLRSPLLSF